MPQNWRKSQQRECLKHTCAVSRISVSRPIWKVLRFTSHRVEPAKTLTSGVTWFGHSWVRPCDFKRFRMSKYIIGLWRSELDVVFFRAFVFQNCPALLSNSRWLSLLWKNIQEKSTRKHTTAAAQARQERLVHSVTHREKAIEATKIRRARRTSWTWGG